MTYDLFIAEKSQLEGNFGFEPSFLPDFLFDFQKDLVAWAVKKGRAAIFADCGMGKTLMEIVWAENVARHTGKPVLILTPLAVAHQFVKEAAKFGLDVSHSKDGRIESNIVVCNYERLHYFNCNDFSGTVCDESSILKNFDGVRKAEITEFMREQKYRLLGTATASPNDYTELGTSSEALGYLGYMDMLSRFFTNKQQTSKQMRGRFGGNDKWRFKGHAEQNFWRWVASWARAVRSPADMGYDAGDFILPPLVVNECVITPDTPPDGMLFALPAIGLQEQRAERSRTFQERCQKVADIVNSREGASIVWCNLNKEADLLESLIDGAVQVSGQDNDEQKEDKFTAFSDGEIKVLITKPKIGAWGMNWQHCSHMTYFPTNSYEQYYQAVRRSWRFGQENPVIVDIVATSGEKPVIDNMKKKQDQADRMFTELVSHMMDSINIDRKHIYNKPVEVPKWL
ncbi:MAG: hypothetical protein KDD89_00075 [Anaerolineales bacterium]|nr:hypothetical protein [Anaerolineales bacterium]